MNTIEKIAKEVSLAALIAKLNSSELANVQRQHMRQAERKADAMIAEQRMASVRRMYASLYEAERRHDRACGLE